LYTIYSKILSICLLTDASFDVAKEVRIFTIVAGKHFYVLKATGIHNLNI